MRRNVEVWGGQAKCIKHSHINQDLQREGLKTIAAVSILTLKVLIMRVLVKECSAFRIKRWTTTLLPQSVLQIVYIRICVKIIKWLLQGWKLAKLENLKMMLGALGLQGPGWVQGKALVRGSGGQRPPEAPGFKLFCKTHHPFPNSSNACCKLQITVIKKIVWMSKKRKELSFIVILYPLFSFCHKR